ncbi:MAG: LPS export ABC transporter periplasmic protein LptC [Pseudomonadota bacterium]|nr:LPS export ABC transporter periplasmic protein LptC [Pseudomonadota bacterium]
MSWRSVITLLLLIGATISGWALWTQRSDPPAETQAGGQPDYVLNDFELIALDAQGKESFTVRAPRLTRDPAIRTLDITTPLFLIPAAEGSRNGDWEVRSKTGWVSADGEELRLRGDVVADSTGETGRPVKMTTEQLNVFPETDMATSAVEVTVTEPGFILTGRRLEANLASGNIRLEDTRTRYENTAR